MPPKEKYTDPDLREEIKEEVKAGDKGGKPGQWSARKVHPPPPPLAPSTQPLLHSPNPIPS